jgi:hypothetical protein
MSERSESIIASVERKQGSDVDAIQAARLAKLRKDAENGDQGAQFQLVTFSPIKSEQRLWGLTLIAKGCSESRYLINYLRLEELREAAKNGNVKAQFDLVCSTNMGSEAKFWGLKLIAARHPQSDYIRIMLDLPEPSPASAPAAASPESASSSPVYAPAFAHAQSSSGSEPINSELEARAASGVEPA